jgi:hypothetical protein
LRALQFGPVLDVIAKKAGGMKEQAFVVFRDVVTAATAMRSLQVRLSQRLIAICIDMAKNSMRGCNIKLHLVIIVSSSNNHLRASNFLAKP